MSYYFIVFLSCFFTLTLHAGKNDSLVPTDIQVSNSHQFLQSETPSLSLMEGTPNAIVFNHVHAITGSFFDAQTDMEIGILPFSLDRSYVSLDHTRGSLLHGWNHNHEEVVKTEYHKNHRYAISKGRSGGEFLYRGYYDMDHLELDPKNFKKGVTNCGRGEISGRTF